MLYTRQGLKFAISAPHHLAAEAGADILKQGGNAIEAMIAAAATIAVVYPHMNGIGGDGFWLIGDSAQGRHGIAACGPAAQKAEIAFYREQGRAEIPPRGPQAALTMAGTVAGWQEALTLSQHWGGRLPLESLLAAAIDHARRGVVVTQNQATVTQKKKADLAMLPGVLPLAFKAGQIPYVEGDVLKQPELAASLEQLARAGLMDFYQGDLACALAKGLEAVGSPLRLEDFQTYTAKRVTPLSLKLAYGTVYNLPPPTQGLSSLMILGLFERLGVSQGESFAHIHGLIEATKQAFEIRDACVCDPAFMEEGSALRWLTDASLEALARKIDRASAQPWPGAPETGDTIWMGCADSQGRVVSFIQSLYWEYGSGVVPDGTGILWQNRGVSFSLSPKHVRALCPGKYPFHTLNPALADLKDGRVLAYGTMGGDGQPQTQAAVLSRYAQYGRTLQDSLTAPRWLLGRTWGAETTSLKLENRFPEDLITALAAAGHCLEIVEDFTSIMGHAGAVCVTAEGVFEGASDPRSDGCAVVL